MRVVMVDATLFHLISINRSQVLSTPLKRFTMLLITLFALTFKPWQANLEYVMIEFADVMNKMIHDEKMTL